MLLWLQTLFLGIAAAGSVFAPTPYAVKFVGKQLYVDRKPFYVKGLCYSPVPIGETIEYPPFGDYFISDYAYIWKRDLALIKSMGVNTIRIYGWDTVHNVTHFEFLDEVHRYGLKVVLTFYVGRNNDNPPVYINTPALLQVPLTNFTREVALYGDHPAILMWSFGNELNGPWNGFLKQLSTLYSCSYSDYGRCWNTETLDASCLKNVECLYKGFFGWLNMAAVQAKAVSTRPITSGLADLDRIVDKNARQVVSKIQLYGHYAPDISSWALQLYKGKSFGSYLNYYANAVEENFKPLIVTEYGVDAYNDPCGWPENRKQTICRNMVGDEIGGPDVPASGVYIGCNNTPSGEVLACSRPGTEIQTKWDIGMTKELYTHRVMPPDATPAPTPVLTCLGPWPGYDQCQPRMDWFSNNWRSVANMTADRCSWQKYLYEEQVYCPDPYKASTGLNIVLGGFLMAWIDERWKGNIPTQAYCKYPCLPSDLAACYNRTADFEPNGAAQCTWGNGAFNVRAHWECTHDTYVHGLCGYGFESMPDFYMNEEWFGLAVPAACGHFAPPSKPGENPQQFGLDALTVRPVMKAFQELWNPDEFAKNIPFQPLTCSQLLPCWQCLQTNKGTNAYLSTCSSVCNLNPPPPTPVPSPTEPPTNSPTRAPTAAPSASPTSVSPSSASPTAAPAPTAVPAPTSAPTSGHVPTSAPTSFPSAVTPSKPPSSQIPVERVELLVKFRMTSHQIQWEVTTTGKKIASDLATLLGVSPTRFTVLKLDNEFKTRGNGTMVELSISPGSDSDISSREIVDKFVITQKEIARDTMYGCTQNCTTYVWPATCGDDCLIRHIDPHKEIESSPVTPEAPATDGESGMPTATIVIIVVISVLIGLAIAFGVIKFCRKQPVEKYSPMTEEGYVPPSIN